MSKALEKESEGWMYLEQLNEIDDAGELAFKAFSEAVDLGSIGAQFGLGCCYSGGEGVEEDLQLAKEWYLKAAINGHLDAMWSLCTLSDELVPLVEQFAWCSIAAEQEYLPAVEEKEYFEEDLSKDEIAQAKKLADKYKEKISKYTSTL